MSAESDSFVWQALAGFSFDDQTAHLAEVSSLLAAVKAAPHELDDALDSFAFELRRQTLMRIANGDPQWVLWSAWVNSVDLVSEVARLEAAWAVR